MTQQEASEHYNIPVSILQEYESWGLCGAVKKVMGVWQYDDEDLERLSTIMTLHDIGFTTEEVETYAPAIMAGRGLKPWRTTIICFTGRTSANSFRFVNRWA